MLRVTQLRLPLEHDQSALAGLVAKKLGITEADIRSLAVHKRTPDARQPHAIKLVYAVNLEVADESAVLERCAQDQTLQQTVRLAPDETYQLPVPSEPSSASHDGPRPVVVGFGPCGMFAGLLLAQMGHRPLILERGKKVRDRTVDTFGFWREGKLNPESNVQFGEGGAGTFSDGKLYSQVRDPNNRGRKVMEEFVEAGAPAEILWQGRPHIGTFRLVKMVENLRTKIESLGGEVRFEARMDGLLIDEDVGEDNQRVVRGLRLSSGEEIRADNVVCALGHSARDTFSMLLEQGVAIERKPFSVGLRVEHPQAIIDARRYGRSAGDERLGAADYRLVHHCQAPELSGRTVYSFCMCPGGTVVAAASEEGGVVTNGMSEYGRGERNANAGIVVSLEPEDFSSLVGSEGPDVLAGIALQQRLERAAFRIGGENYNAPAQLVGDFLADRASTTLGSVTPSYQPGVTLTHLGECLPDWVTAAIQEAFPAFEKKLGGFSHDEAVLTGVETRTSSPIRFPRGEDLQSENTRGLFPAGEGAGYAGGILSAGMDGIKVAEAVARSLG